MKSTIHQGQCMCGAVTFTVADLRPKFGVCHCDMCRRWTGSSFVGITVDGAKIEFNGAEHIQTRQTSQWAERAWCGECGTGLWYRLTASDFADGSYEIPLGTLANIDGLSMAREIFTDQKPDGYAFTGNHKRLTRAETLSAFGIDPGEA